MQSLRWYRQRLASMSGGEIAWRLRSSARDAADRLLIPLNLYTPPAVLRSGREPIEPAFRVSHAPVGVWAGETGTAAACWRERLVARATAILEHRLSFFNLLERPVGHPVDWHRDHEHDIPSPRGLAQSIDYRDFRVTGDAKNVWEPNRHQHLVVLARAYRATGDARFAREVIEQIESWLGANPFGRGMNWRSPLELAIRVINWVWALDLIRESGVVDAARLESIRRSAWMHAWEIQRKYSRGSSANNHRIGEAAGVFVACTYWPDFPHAREWADESRAILEQEILAQTFGDGGNREQAFGYHAFVAQFLLAAGLAARRSGADFSTTYWSWLERMLDFLAALVDGGREAPMFGDADDGFVLDLGGRPTDARWLAGIGAVLFDRSDLAAAAREPDEALFWLLGAEAPASFERLAAAPRAPLTSRAFPDSGWYLLQAGGRPDASISVLFDCGELGFRTIAAHGHADALSVIVRAFDHDILVDPGTYDYFTFPAWREYFRGTAAHNTVVVDEFDQSRKLGPFLWGTRATSRCLAWNPAPGGGSVTGSHDGYHGLADPVRHRRTVTLEGDAGLLTIADTLESRESHRIALHLHLGEECRVTAIDGTVAELEVGRHTVRIESDHRLAVDVLEGSEHPGPGWVSRGYHRKTATCTLRAAGVHQGTATYETVLRFCPSTKGCRV